MKISKKVLLYGCGTICKLIIDNQIDLNAEITSSIEEEINKTFCGKFVLDLNNINFDDFDMILITPIGYNEKILKKFDPNLNHKIYWVTIKDIKNKTIYSICGFNESNTPFSY